MSGRRGRLNPNARVLRSGRVVNLPPAVPRNPPAAPAPPQPPPPPPLPPPPPPALPLVNPVPAVPVVIMAAVPVVPNIAVSSAHKPNIFGGLSSENGSEFLRQFELYCNIHRLVLVEPAPVPIPPATQPACYRFQACISGDAARWYSSLPAANTATWPDIRAAFLLKYCNLVNDWTENVSLKAIRQKVSEPVESYAGRFYTQIRRMGKKNDESTPDFVSGLLPELRTAVFMARPGNADDVIAFAKLAELCQIKKNAEEIAAIESAEDALQSADPIERKAQILNLADGLKEIKESLANLH